MIKTRALAVLAAFAVLAGTAVAVAPGASAATKQNAYSWNGYKAKITPKGNAPKGKHLVSKTVSVGKFKIRKSVWLKPGTYKVTTKVKYNTKVKYTAYRTVTEWVDADSCKITAVKVISYDDYGNVDVRYTGKCTGESWEQNKAVSFTSTWNTTEYLYDDQWCYDEFDEAYQCGSDFTPEYAVGDQVRDMWEIGGSGKVSFKQAYTKTKYSATKTKTYTRTVKVAKVKNTSKLTRTEFGTFDDGDKLSYVRKVAGSKGHLEYDDGDYRAYSWSNATGGGTTWVYLDNGRVYSKVWVNY